MRLVRDFGACAFDAITRKLTRRVAACAHAVRQRRQKLNAVHADRTSAAGAAALNAVPLRSTPSCGRRAIWSTSFTRSGSSSS
jgi:hypothetical protein